MVCFPLRTAAIQKAEVPRACQLYGVIPLRRDAIHKAIHARQFQLYGVLPLRRDAVVNSNVHLDKIV